MGIFRVASSNAGTLASITPPVQYNTLWEFMTNVLPFVSSIAFVLLLILLVYAGFVYMTAAGNDNKIKTAYSIIRAAIIGIIIIVLSLTITSVLKEVLGIT